MSAATFDRLGTEGELVWHDTSGHLHILHRRADVSPSSFLVNSHVPRLGGLCWAQPERVHGDDFHTHARVGSKPPRTHSPKF